MKPSKRNLHNERAAKEKLMSKPPVISKYAAKVRKQYVDEPKAKA